MKSEEPSRCECEFDPNTGRLGKIHFFNCPDDQDARTRVAVTRIEQLKKQIASQRSGLTNRGRQALAKEVYALERAFNLGAYSPVAQVDDANKDKRLK